MTILDAMQAANRRPRPRQAEDISAPLTSSNVAGGMELGPALTKLFCRECGAEVDGIRCPKCEEKH